MTTARVVIITGTIPTDLQAAANVMAYFVTIGCTLQSSDLHGTTFLYTLTNPRGFYNNTDYLTTLQGIHNSSAFDTQSSILLYSCLNLKIRLYPIHSAIIIVAFIIILSVSITCIAIFSKNRNSTTTTDISVLFNQGNGTFADPVTYAVGTTPLSVAMADVNEDGKPDIFVTNRNSKNISILINNNNGTFADQVTYLTEGELYFITADDMNSDDKYDILVASRGKSNIGIFFNQGNGTFAEQIIYPSGVTPHSLAVADLNNNNKRDIIVGNAGSDNIGVLLADCI